jgi:hypothetical protein
MLANALPSVARLALEQMAPSSHRPAHRHIPSRCARAMRRVRRCAARRCRRWSGRVRTRKAHPFSSGGTLRAAPRPRKRARRSREYDGAGVRLRAAIAVPILCASVPSDTPDPAAVAVCTSQWRRRHGTGRYAAWRYAILCAPVPGRHARSPVDHRMHQGRFPSARLLHPGKREATFRQFLCVSC